MQVVQVVFLNKMSTTRTRLKKYYKWLISSFSTTWCKWNFLTTDSANCLLVNLLINLLTHLAFKFVLLSESENISLHHS